MPTNARVLLATTAAVSAAAIVRRDGAPDEPLSIEFRPSELAGVLEWSPSEGLDSSERYSISMNGEVYCDTFGPPCVSGEVLIVSFTTSDDADEDQPAWPVLPIVSGVQAYTCDEAACCGPYQAFVTEIDTQNATVEDAGPVSFNVYDDAGEIVAPFSSLRGLRSLFWTYCEVDMGGGLGDGTPAFAAGTYQVRAMDTVGRTSLEGLEVRVDDLCDSLFGEGPNDGGPTVGMQDGDANDVDAGGDDAGPASRGSGGCSGCTVTSSTRLSSTWPSFILLLAVARTLRVRGRCGGAGVC